MIYLYKLSNSYSVIIIAHSFLQAFYLYSQSLNSLKNQVPESLRGERRERERLKTPSKCLSVEETTEGRGTELRSAER